MSLLNEEEELMKWKTKRLIKSISTLKGSGTSMITLIIPPNDQISKVNQMLSTEMGTATNIKSRENRQSVVDAITWSQQKLKLYKNVPKNGLVILCGMAMDLAGSVKKISIDFEPFRPVVSSLYMCDSKFDLSQLESLMESNLKYGFIIIDGNGFLIAELCGDRYDILYHYKDANLPSKHNKGGQSALRFERLTKEARANYVRKAAENVNNLLIKENEIKVDSIIVAGNASFKFALLESQILDDRIKKKVIKTLDIAYGGEAGLRDAIAFSKDIIQGAQFNREKELIQKFFNDIGKDTGMIVYGLQQTMKLLEEGLIEKLILCEDITFKRGLIRGEPDKIIYYLPSDKQKKEEKEGKVYQEEDLLDHLNEKYRDYSVQLSIVSQNTGEGVQFMSGFGGIGGFLRYKYDISLLEEDEAEIIDDDDFI
jgi:peptide chain release factor subunit 1